MNQMSDVESQVMGASLKSYGEVVRISAGFSHDVSPVYSIRRHAVKPGTDLGRLCWRRHLRPIRQGARWRLVPCRPGASRRAHPAWRHG
jgi:hypothetical protein